MGFNTIVISSFFPGFKKAGKLKKLRNFLMFLKTG